MSKKKKTKNPHTKTKASSSARYDIYTDGGCAVNPGGPGGYGVVILDKTSGELTEHTGAYAPTTNNRMEIMAVLEALSHIPDGESAVIHSDSEYVVNTLNGYYQQKKNTDLWKKCNELSKGKTLQFVWVRGHNGNPQNERCDELATAAMQDGPWKEDAGYRDSKKKGAEFFANAEIHFAKSAGAMSVQIEISKELDGDLPALNSRSAYAEEHGVHTTCAKALLDFWMVGDRSFKAYLSLKTGGLDSWSRKKQNVLLEGLENPDEVWQTITSFLPSEKDAITCLRWHRRGLQLHDAIRKVLVDKEVAENCR